MIDKNFFKKYQKFLVWFSNTFIGRWFFCIDKEIKDIVEVLPQSLIYNKRLVRFGKDDWRWQQTACVRTHNKYSKLINYRFRYLHRLAYLLPAFLKPELGIATMLLMPLTVRTVYPDANPETTSVDGYVWHQENLSWASLIAAAGNNNDDYNGNANVVGIYASSTTDIWANLRRGIFGFDTSFIQSGGTVTDATLSIYGYGKTDGLSITPDVNIYSASPASNTALVAGDFDSLGSVAFSTTVAYAGWSIVGYNDFILNASGIANIQKGAGGISNFGTRNANYDVAGTAPAWIASVHSYLRCYTAEASGTTTDPKLVVTYTGGTAFYQSCSEIIDISSTVVNTGLRSPAATGGAYSSWTNPTNAYTSNDVYATASGDGVYQEYDSFNLNIPAGATIVGVEVKVEGFSGANSTLGMYLGWDGGSWGDWVSDNNYLPSTEGIITYGGPTSLWGRSWSASDFSNANFRAMLATVDVDNYSVDHIQVKVYYEANKDVVEFVSGKWFAETIAIVDTIAIQKALHRTYSEIISITDTVKNQTVRILTETISVVDTAIKIPIKILSEVITIVDNVLIQKVLHRTLSEVITIVDTLANKTAKIFNETITVVDGITKSVGKVLSEVITIVDTIKKTTTRVFAETITIVDGLTNKATKVLSETIVIVDSISKKSFKVILETIMLIESLYMKLNGVNVKWIRKYVEKVGSFTRKYSEKTGTFIKKYFKDI